MDRLGVGVAVFAWMFVIPALVVGACYLLVGL